MTTRQPFPQYVDSSMVASFKACQSLFNLTYLKEWKPKDGSIHLTAGGAFAKGIEATRDEFYNKGSSSEASIAKGLGALMQAYGDYQCPPDSAKSLERVCGAFEFYWDNYPLDNENDPIVLAGGKRAIEFSFAEPLEITHPESGDPILYVGRMDAIINYAGGKYICDEKTTTQLGASWSRQWDLRAQFTGYAWACQKANIHVDGAIVRGVSILKTKYDTQQAISYRPEWQIERWYDELHQWLRYMKDCWQSNKWLHNLDHACAEYGGCKFREVCSSQDGFAENFLETYFEKRHWNPLLRVETPV